MKTLAEAADKQEVLKRIAALKPDAPRRWGKMSCHQMVVHLSDAFLCPMGERQVSRARVLVPRGVYRRIALNMPMQWPRGIATRPEMEQGVGGTAPVEFAADREKLVALIGRFTHDHFEWAEHPIFGAMSEKDWMRWAICTATTTCGSLGCEVPMWGGAIRYQKVSSHGRAWRRPTPISNEKSRLKRRLQPGMAALQGQSYRRSSVFIGGYLFLFLA